MRRPMRAKSLVWKGVALAAGIGLAMLSYPLHAAPSSGGDTVQGLYDALLCTMKNGRILGQSGRFTQLEPVIRRTFDIASMTRLSVGASSWAGLSEAQRQQSDRFAGTQRDFLSIRSTQLEPAQKVDAPAVHPAHRDAGSP